MLVKTRKRLQPIPRKRLPVWSPQWEGTLRAWSLKLAVKDLWKVETVDFGLEDLIAEAQYCLAKCIHYYWPDRAKTPGHFFSLYRTTFLNRINRLALAKTRRVDVVSLTTILPLDPELAVEVFGSLLSDNGDSAARAELEVLLGEAPDEWVEAVGVLAQAGPRRLESFFARQLPDGCERLLESIVDFVTEGVLPEPGAVPCIA